MAVWTPQQPRATATTASRARSLPTALGSIFASAYVFATIQELMLERANEVSHEAIRLWCLKFGAEYARRLRRRRGRPGDTWHFDEVFCKMNGELVYLRRAVDQSGEVLGILVHQPTRERERAMRRFKSMRHAQRSLSVHARVSNHCRPGRHLMQPCNDRASMTGRFASWSEITGVPSSKAISV
jgi:transposase-like protein